MNAGILDLIVGTFVAVLDGAYGTLWRYSIPLLAILGLMYFLIAVGQLVISHYSLAALGDVLWVILKWGVVYFVVFFLFDRIWNGAFMTFLQWGLEAGGGAFGLSQFLQPSLVVDAGFVAAVPLYDYIQSFSGFGMAWNIATVLLFLGAYWLIVFAFAVMALHAMMTIIEMKLAIAVGTVLVPWAILTQTAVLGELSLSWMAAGLVRVLLTAALMSIGVPLFETLAFPGGSPATGGADPTIYQALVVALAALVFAILTWVLPSRAAAIGGRGMALAISGDSLVTGGMAGVSMARYAWHAGAGAIRGASQMLQRPTGRA
jgi:type IV secretory pathway TrbL component